MSDTSDITRDSADTSAIDTVGSSYIINGSLVNGNWYIPDASNDIQYFSFTNSKINYKLSYNRYPGIGVYKTGDLTFLNTDLSKFEYRWDGSVSGSEKTENILILDNDILLVKGGFDCTNEIGMTHICYKDLSAYTDSIPFMGIGKTTQNNYSEWFVFTPSGNCYKRYSNFQTNELLIVSGTWEKTSEQTYKIYWNKSNKNKYDILKGTKLYQNASENSNAVPVNLYVSRY